MDAYIVFSKPQEKESNFMKLTYITSSECMCRRSIEDNEQQDKQESPRRTRHCEICYCQHRVCGFGRLNAATVVGDYEIGKCFPNYCYPPYCLQVDGYEHLLHIKVRYTSTKCDVGHEGHPCLTCG